MIASKQRTVSHVCTSCYTYIQKSEEPVDEKTKLLEKLQVREVVGSGYATRKGDDDD